MMRHLMSAGGQLNSPITEYPRLSRDPAADSDERILHKTRVCFFPAKIIYQYLGRKVNLPVWAQNNCFGSVRYFRPIPPIFGLGRGGLWHSDKIPYQVQTLRTGQTVSLTTRTYQSTRYQSARNDSINFSLFGDNILPIYTVSKRKR